LSCEKSCGDTRANDHLAAQGRFADDFAAARLLSGVDAHGELLSEQIGWLGRSRRSFYRLIKHHHFGEEGVNVARMH